VDGENYAKEAIVQAIKRGSKAKRNTRKTDKNTRGVSNESFLQRDAVVETLISHCQISAPLLKLFPPAWQRALLANAITLIAAIVSDFASGIKVQFLGHQLSFTFQPITVDDFISYMQERKSFSDHHRAKSEAFEAAVVATAQDISESLTFLDKWHERALGSGVLRAQLGSMIARIILTLVDEVLSGATLDLWRTQAGGPRVMAGLEYRARQQ